MADSGDRIRVTDPFHADRGASGVVYLRCARGRYVVGIAREGGHREPLVLRADQFWVCEPKGQTSDEGGER